LIYLILLMVVIVLKQFQRLHIINCEVLNLFTILRVLIVALNNKTLSVNVQYFYWPFWIRVWVNRWISPPSLLPFLYIINCLLWQMTNIDTLLFIFRQFQMVLVILQLFHLILQLFVLFQFRGWLLFFTHFLIIIFKFTYKTDFV